MHRETDFCVFTGFNVFRGGLFQKTVAVLFQRHGDHQARKLAIELVDCRSDETVKLAAMVAGVIEQATDSVGRFGGADEWKSTDIK